MANDVATGLITPAALDAALSRIAAAHGKNKSDLIRQALTEFAACEEAVIAKIEEGRAAIRNGDFVSHDEVIRQTKDLLADRG